jgi:predicted transcriptional regulator
LSRKFIFSACSEIARTFVVGNAHNTKILNLVGMMQKKLRTVYRLSEQMKLSQSISTVARFLQKLGIPSFVFRRKYKMM